MLFSPWDEMFLTMPASRAPQLRPCRRSRSPVKIPRKSLWMESNANDLGFKMTNDGRAGVATVKLPRGVKGEDLDLDLREATRTLTIKVGGWSQRFKLDGNFDTEQLQADFDPVKCELRLSAPRLASERRRARSVSETESDEGFASELDRSPSPSAKRTLDDRTSEQAKPATTPKKPEITIEDVGPEEELDY